MQARRSAWAFLEDGHHEVSSPRACRSSAWHHPFARGLLRRTAGRSGAGQPTGEHHARPKHAVTFTEHHHPDSRNTVDEPDGDANPAAGGFVPGPASNGSARRRSASPGAASCRPTPGAGATPHGSAAPAAPQWRRPRRRR
ncbi:hypothetical protein ACSVHC_20625 [Arthrobacter sp. KNU-44]|uniref:hypothetical protein n=1 Tax=unclassified Arthrobacter TaxID=235627 RepID=UPI003F42518E